MIDTLEPTQEIEIRSHSRGYFTLGIFLLLPKYVSNTCDLLDVVHFVNFFTK